MSEPFVPPSAPQPFAPSPRPVGGGCGKLALVGCGALLLLLGVGAVIVAMQGERVVHWLFGIMESSILEKAPADVTAAERERFQRAFDAAVTKATTGPGDPVLLQKLQTALVETSQRPITRQAFVDLTQRLEGLAAPVRDEEETAPEGDDQPETGPPAEALPGEAAPDAAGDTDGASSTAAVAARAVPPALAA